MRVVATGDALFGSTRLRERVDPALVELFASTPFVFTNAEFVAASAEDAVMNVGYSLGARGDRSVAELKDLGITVASVANNHTGDYGPSGVVSTMAAFAAHGIVAAGAGVNLAQAREAVFVDAAQGRLAVVAACTTWGDAYAAGDGGRWNAPRPGLNPLRWSQSYEVTPEQFEALRGVDAALGTARTHQETLEVERKWNPDESSFAFGPLSGGLTIRRGEQSRVVWEVDPQDLAQVCRAIRDAVARAEVVVASIHTHEGEDDGWYSDLPAGFVIEAARAMVDAGAHAVVCHGAHILRGVEIHRGRPIFYGLHSLLFDLESGDRIPHEMYTRYGLPADSFPSDLHGVRRRDAAGDPVGFYGDRRFELSLAAIIDVDPITGATTAQALPFVLNLNAEQPSRRGIPSVARGAQAQEIADEVAWLSQSFGTTVTLDRGRLHFS